MFFKISRDRWVASASLALCLFTAGAARAADAASPARARHLAFLTVSVAPAQVTVSTGSSQAFSCAVVAGGGTSCAWSVEEGAAGGSVTVGGLYTAPLAVGTYHLIAANPADPSQKGRATVSVVPAPAGAGACNGLPAAGTWQNVTPPGVNIGVNVQNFGASTVVIDPTDAATIYVAIDQSGIFRSKDCGNTWVHINTGTLGAGIDRGAPYTLHVDPVNPHMLFTGSLYGDNGLFKSLDGGVNWTSVFPASIASQVPYNGFIDNIAVDPGDSRHWIVSWHASCSAPHVPSCYAETLDNGDNWAVRDGNASWAGGETNTFNFINSDLWLFSQPASGLWTSVDRGASWQKVPNVQASWLPGQLYRHGPAGPYYLATGEGVYRSANGLAWALLPGSGSMVTGLAGDGITLWANSSFPYNAGARPGPGQPYIKASESAPGTWTTFSSAPLTTGGPTMRYDPIHHVLYSANYWEGLWRVVLP